MFRIAILGLAMVWSAIASAQDTAVKQYFNAVELWNDCSMEREDTRYFVAQASCRSYVVGVVDATRLTARILGGTIAFCIPEGVSAGEVTEAVIQSLRTNPPNEAEPASIRVVFALIDAYPCNVQGQ